MKTLRLHGDCHAGNVLWTRDGPHFVDFDDARTGPAVQDLWMLLSGDRAAMTRQLSDVLSGYEDFHDFDPRELHLVEALRTLRLIHYAAWIARRWDDPAFPAAFPWFNTPRYWQDRILELREQIAAMDEAPLAVLSRPDIRRSLRRQRRRLASVAQEPDPRDDRERGARVEREARPERIPQPAGEPAARRAARCRTRD